MPSFQSELRAACILARSQEAFSGQPFGPDAGEKRVFVQEIQQGPPREGHPQWRGDLAEQEAPWIGSQELLVLGRSWKPDLLRDLREVPIPL